MPCWVRRSCSEKDVTAITRFASDVRLFLALRALLAAPCGRLHFGCFQLPLSLQFLGANCISLVHRTLRMNASQRVRSFAAHRTHFATGLRRQWNRLLFTHPAKPPAKRTHDGLKPRAQKRSQIRLVRGLRTNLQTTLASSANSNIACGGNTDRDSDSNSLRAMSRR